MIINTESHPFDDEQHIAIAVSTKSYDDSLPLDPRRWVTGGTPRESFVSPWAIHSPQTNDLVAWQGRLTEAFVAEIVDAAVSYLRE